LSMALQLVTSPFTATSCVCKQLHLVTTLSVHLVAAIVPMQSKYHTGAIPGTLPMDSPTARSTSIHCVLVQRTSPTKVMASIPSVLANAKLTTWLGDQTRPPLQPLLPSWQLLELPRHPLHPLHPLQPLLLLPHHQLWPFHPTTTLHLESNRCLELCLIRSQSTKGSTTTMHGL
jgi:hypothetical protein